MQVKVIMQNENENTLASAISQSLEENAKKAYFFVGNFKETGYSVIEDYLIDIKTKLFFAIGIDKKATTKSMLDGLLSYTDDVYYYSNNNLNEFVSNICVFEYSDRAYMYVSGSNISESGLTTDISLYTKITYDLKDSTDKAEYKAQIKTLLKVIDDANFKKLDKNEIKKLVESKEIFSTRQYNHSVMSISELLGKNEKKEEKDSNEAKKVENKVIENNVEIPKIDLSNIAIDIDLPENEEKKPDNDELKIDYTEDKIELPKDVEKYEEDEKKSENITDKVNNNENDIDENNELYDPSMADDDLDYSKTLDINNMLFSKANVKLDVKNTKEESKKDEILEDKFISSKKINLNNVSDLIFETSAKTSKENFIKIPNQVRLMIPKFFGLDEAVNEEVDGVVYKVKHISLEILNVKSNEKYIDEDAKILYKPRQSYLMFESDKLTNVEYGDNDIIRINKIDENKFYIEIINKKMQEYNVWKKLCNQNFRTSTKKFGVM